MSPDPGPAPDASAANDRFVRALARRIAGDPHLGDDAAQETWLKALQHAQAPGLFAGGFAELGRAWLGVVARNMVLQALRGSQRRSRREQAVARERGDGTVQGGDSLLDGERRALLLAAVQALPDDYRAVVRLRFFDDRMPVDIADTLGVPVETVRTRLKRALGRLREAITAP